MKEDRRRRGRRGGGWVDGGGGCNGLEGKSRRMRRRGGVDAIKRKEEG